MDLYAAMEATSVYTEVAIFPMLSGELSTEQTSLLDAQDRCSIVLELEPTFQARRGLHWDCCRD